MYYNGYSLERITGVISKLNICRKVKTNRTLDAYSEYRGR